MKTTVILEQQQYGRLVLDINLWTIKSHLEDLFQQVLEHRHYTQIYTQKIAIFLPSRSTVVTGLINNVSSAARQNGIQN
jgi:hypothetical protein